MKRPYYAIKDRETNSLVAPIWYDDKMKAKKKRNELNGPRPENFKEGTKERYFITTAIK